MPGPGGPLLARVPLRLAARGARCPRAPAGTLADALFAGSRHWPIALHCNKGLARAPADRAPAAQDTAMNPVVLEAFALAIIGGGGPPAFADLPGPAPNVSAARQQAGAISQAMEAVLQVVPQLGAYVAESDFFEPQKGMIAVL